MVVLLGSAAILSVWAWRSSRRAAVARSRGVALDTRYRNARPGVKFVGDAACARCHAEIAESYRRHPMGRSLSPIASAPMPEGQRDEGTTFEADGLRYTVERRDGRLVHTESRRDSSGHLVEQIEVEIRYALGSGTRGVSYLLDRDGYLYQSPISWYS